MKLFKIIEIPDEEIIEKFLTSPWAGEKHQFLALSDSVANFVTTAGGLSGLGLSFNRGPEWSGLLREIRLAMKERGLK